MSEKRFYLGNNDTTICDRSQGGSDGFNMLTIFKVVDLLNEQQDFIYQLQDLCGKSDYENAKLRLKNKKLQEEIKLLKPTNVEQYEQIVQLQEENEQLRQSQDVKEFSALFNQSIALQREIKDLKDDLHNCRLNKNIISEKLKIWQDVHKEYNIYNIKDFEKLMKSVKQKQ